MPTESPAIVREATTEAITRLHARALIGDRQRPKRKKATSTGAKRRKTPPVPPPEPGNTLTDDGRRALAAALGLDAPPPWDEIRNVHLPALGLGLSPGSEAAHKLLGQGENSPVAAITNAVLRIEFGIPKATSLSALADALIAEAVGLSGPVTLPRLRAHVIARRVGADAKGDLEQTAARVVKKTLRASSAAKPALVQALARRWVSAGTATPEAATPRKSASTSPAPTGAGPSAPTVVHAPPPGSSERRTAPSAPAITPDALLAMVRDAIPTIGADGRFGPEKVFVSAIWHQLERDRRVADYSLDRFKQWLVTANRDRLLDLVRADLVGAMDSRLVTESEIEHLGTTFHFVLDRGVATFGAEGRLHAR
ncbi:MAG TPA: hypothetical protein VGD37_39725 [Kofleriaceae bacterium]